MNKAIIALVLVLAVSVQPAIAGKSGAGRQADAPKSKKTEEQRYQRATVSSAGQAECKKYFPVIGKVVAVPCP